MAGLLKNKYVYASDRLDFSRSIFRYEKRHSTNLLSGYIVPVHHMFCYPGTSVDLNFGCVLESAPIISTCLDNIYVDIVSIWTPCRLVMTDWNEFLGESHTQAFTINRNITIPKLTTITTTKALNPNKTGGPGDVNINQAYLADNYLAPHLGFRLWGDIVRSGSTMNLTDNINHTTFSIPTNSMFYKGISVLPSRVYELNWNTFFRNENVQAPILIDKTSTLGTHDTNAYTYALGHLLLANKLKTWYNVATPAPSLLDVSLALDTLMPVMTASYSHGVNTNAMTFADSNGTLLTDKNYFGLNTYGSFIAGGSAPSGTNSAAIPNNLYADLAGLTVNKMYYALMEQRFANKMMKGRRAVEFYSNFFGVQDSDADYDLPKLLVQKRFPVNISQVISTAAGTNGTETTDLGQRGAYSTTGFGDSLIKNFTANEHGFIQTYMIIRGQPSLNSGIDKYLAYDGLLDTYIPEFDHIGPVGIEKIELGAGANGYFGYTNAWYSERNPVSDVVGIMSVGAPLAYKTLALQFNSNAVISSSFIEHSPKIIDRIFQFPVCYGTPGDSYDPKGQEYISNRYQFLTQFVVKGKIAAVMSPDSEPLKLRL